MYSMLSSKEWMLSYNDSCDYRQMVCSKKLKLNSKLLYCLSFWDVFAAEI